MDQHELEAAEARTCYIAGPFFNPEQKRGNTYLRVCVRGAGLTHFAPAIECLYDSKVDPPAVAKRAFALNVFHIGHADFVLADLRWPDTGTAWELGYAYSEGIPILGVFTAEQKVNLMLRQTIDGAVEDRLLEAALVRIAEACSSNVLRDVRRTIRQCRLINEPEQI